MYLFEHLFYYPQRGPFPLVRINKFYYITIFKVAYRGTSPYATRCFMFVAGAATLDKYFKILGKAKTSSVKVTTQLVANGGLDVGGDGERVKKGRSKKGGKKEVSLRLTSDPRLHVMFQMSFIRFLSMELSWCFMKIWLSIDYFWKR